MGATVAKWGNSLAIRIPQNLAKQIQLGEGDTIDLVIVDGNLVIKPRSRKQYSLDELVSAITPDNLHPEVESGAAMGNEAW
jgi:antitoxin MazE